MNISPLGVFRATTVVPIDSCCRWFNFRRSFRLQFYVERAFNSFRTKHFSPVCTDGCSTSCQAHFKAGGKISTTTGNDFAHTPALKHVRCVLRRQISNYGTHLDISGASVVADTLGGVALEREFIGASHAGVALRNFRDVSASSTLLRYKGEPREVLRKWRLARGKRNAYGTKKQNETGGYRMS